MGWFHLEFGQDSRAVLDRLTASIALLVTSTKQNGATMTVAIDKLTAELAKFTATEATLSTAVQAVAAALQADAAKINELTDALAAANAANDEAAIEALIPQFDALSDKFTADASTLQSAVTPPATPPAQPA